MQHAPSIVIPAYNEAGNIKPLQRRLKAAGLASSVYLVDDGSKDATAEEAEAAGFRVIRQEKNQGIGPSVQAGMAAALADGAEWIVRLDADGQHPPEKIPDLLHALNANPGLDLIVASRYLGQPAYTSTPIRRLGTVLLAAGMSRLCGRKITDPTSGFWAMRKDLAEHFVQHYPAAWPEAEALIQLHRHGFRARETGAPFQARGEGRSSIHGWKSWAYVGHCLWVLCTAPLRTVPY